MLKDLLKREGSANDGARNLYTTACANKLTVERFDAQKMREWFRLPS